MTASPAEVRSEIQKLERKHAENPDGRYFVPLANAYRKAGEVDRAVSILRQGIGKHPEYVSAHIVLGRCFADLGDRPGAESEFQRVLSLDAQNLVALRALGELAASSGDADAAKRWYESLLSVDPMNEEGRQALEAIERGYLPVSESVAASQPSGPVPAAMEPLPPELVAEPYEGYSEDLSGTGPREEAGSLGQDLSGALASELEGETGGFSVGSFPASVKGAGGPTEEGAREQEPYAAAEAVVTETIAELYTRQGFYDRAADVYRELIRRRGEDPRLQERLEAVLAQAAEEAEPARTRGASGPRGLELTTAAQDAFADSFAVGFPAEEFAPSEPPRQASERFGPRPVRVYAPVTAAAETIRESIRSMLAWRPGGEYPAATAEPAAAPPAAPAAESEAARPAEEEAAFESEGWTAPLDVPTAATPNDGGLAGAAAETPAGSDAFAPADPRPFEATAAQGETFTTRPEMEPALEPGSTSVPDQGLDRSGAAVGEPEAVLQPPGPFDDDDLFPWEIPLEEEGKSSASMPSAPEPQLESTPPFEFGDREAEVPVEDESFEAENVSGLEPTSAHESTPAPEQPSAEEETDEDLESFQAWLRSLKR